LLRALLLAGNGGKIVEATAKLLTEAAILTRLG
jgi:hypothetical protein